MSSGRDGGVRRRRSRSRWGKGSCGHHSGGRRRNATAGVEFLRDSMLIGLSISVMAGCRFLRGGPGGKNTTSSKQSAPARNIYGVSVSRAQSKPSNLWAGRQIPHRFFISRRHLQSSSARIHTDSVKRLKSRRHARQRAKNSDNRGFIIYWRRLFPGRRRQFHRPAAREMGGLGNLADGGSGLVETALRVGAGTDATP